MSATRVALPHGRRRTTLAAIAVAVWRFQQAPNAPRSTKGVIDAAMSKLELRYDPSQLCPGPAYSSLKQIGTSDCVLRPAQA